MAFIIRKQTVLFTAVGLGGERPAQVSLAAPPVRHLHYPLAPGLLADVSRHAGSQAGVGGKGQAPSPESQRWWGQKAQHEGEETVSLVPVHQVGTEGREDRSCRARAQGERLLERRAVHARPG